MIGSDRACKRRQHWQTDGKADRQEASDTELLKEVELGGVALPTGVQQLRHLVTQLEGSALKAHVGSRADLQDEAKVDVDQPALGVNQDVAVVPVLGLEQVAGNGVPVAWGISHTNCMLTGPNACRKQAWV